jgi:tetratricopeptide (TPR) repeat protein
MPASAAVLVVGNSTARSCYEEAESGGSDVFTGMDACDQALREEPLDDHDRAATYVNRGILKLRIQEPSAALRDFDAAIHVNPNEAEAYLNKGVVTLYTLHDSADAVALFTAALDRKTRRPAAAHFGRAAAYEDGGQLRAAYSDYLEASRLEPGWRDARAELSRFRFNPQ